jgi:exodeoxyribonuclease VII small subunit
VANKSKDPSFENSLEELEKIIGGLEQGEAPLENQLKAFERGIALSRDCLKRLDEVERKVQLLVQDENGEIQAKDFAE